MRSAPTGPTKPGSDGAPTICASIASSGSPTLVSSDGTTLPGSDAFYSFRNRSRSWEFVENVIWARGRHIFKFGGEALLRRIDGYLTAGRDSYFGFSGFANFARDAPLVFLAAISRQNARPLTTPDYDRQYRYNQSYLFAQDSFKLSSRFVIDYGIRYERFGAPSNTGPVKDTVFDLGAGNTLGQRLTAGRLQFPSGGTSGCTIRTTTISPRAPGFPTACAVAGARSCAVHTAFSMTGLSITSGRICGTITCWCPRSP